MKKLILYILPILVSLSVHADIGNAGDGTQTDNIGIVINASRFLAASNMVVTNITAKVVGVPGHYKCAIYSGSATTPSQFLIGTKEISTPTNGWYDFPLTSVYALTNSQNYWLAIWSDNTGARVYYTAGGTLRWGNNTNYGNWPTTLNTIGSGSFNYCIYAKDVIINVTNPPPFLNTFTLTLMWNQTTDDTVVGTYVYWGIQSNTYTNKISVVGTNAVTVSLPRTDGTTYYFSATAYNKFDLESLFSNEVFYQYTNTPPPTIIYPPTSFRVL